MKKITAIGLSHAFMLKSAYKLSNDNINYSFEFPLVGPVEIPKIFNHKNNAITLPDSILEVIKRLGSDDFLAISIANNEHNEVGLFFKDKEFFIPSPTMKIEAEVKDNSDFMPASLIAEHFREKLGSLRFFIQLLKVHIASQKLLVLEGVPPVGDLDYIKNFLRERGFSDLDIVDRETHNSLFAWQCKITEDLCREERVEYITYPDNVIDENGFMLEKYWQNASHANHHYGSLVLQKICTHIQKMEGETANV